MNKKNNNPKIIIIILILAMIFFPYILRLECVKYFISDWLSFSNNVDYKIAYIQLVGGVLGTFISVYGALYIQKEQQRTENENKKKECARKIYIELRTCFNELQGIVKDTKLAYNLSEIEKEDIEKVCRTAVGKKLSMNEGWVDNLAGSGNIFSGFDTNMIYKYYFKLQVIQHALETKKIEEIEKVYIPYICWFIDKDGKGLNGDIEHFMNRMDLLTQ